ncbi:hypothetical protein JTE90_020275 [Oedothorax gibbosus]|uniref:H15 domain-containing protein n=1 Tax=Oedothorax gibbosus TaxID=931172 RepID=A0AAV6VQ68_9ARAC|nr:hypothetical protein JTE90_020275 [Oedothorax gibbosus]
MDKPLEINLESCSILLNSHKDISENQQDSSGIISRDEFSDNSSYEKMASRSKTLVQETSSIVSAASLLEKEHSSHITFAGSETETHTPYTKHEIALTSDSVKLNYDSDARGDGHRKIEENQSIFNERQIKNKAICVLEENSTITDKKLDEQSINYSAIGSENISFLDKINVTHTEDALISTASYSDKKCIILTTPDMFPDFKEKTPFDDRYFKVQNASIETYKEKEDTSIKDVLAKVLLTIHNNTNDSDNNGDRKTSEKGLAKTTPQFQNNCLEPVEFKFSEIVPNPSKNIKEMEITRDDAKSIQETPNFVKTDFKPSTQEFHQLQKNTPNGTETVKFQYNSENPLLFSSSSTLRKNLIVDCSYEINTEENSTLDFQKNLPENDHVTKEILRIKQDDLKDFGIQKLENFCCTNIKALTEEVSSNNTVDFSQDSVNSQNSFHTQVTIKDCTGLYPITESEPSRKETSNLLNTDIVLKHLKDLYDIDKSIAQAVLISISELDRKTGVKQSQILNYIKKNQMIPFHPKLHLEISKFLTSACEVGIIKKKAFKFMLSDQVQALAAEHKMEEARVKHLTRSKSRQIDTIEKKLSSPIYSPKLLRYNRAHLKRCSK